MKNIVKFGRLLRFLGLACLALAIAFALLIGGLHVYLCAPQRVEWLRETLSARIGGRVIFETLHLNLLSGIVFKNVMVSSGSANDDTFFSLERLRLHYVPSSLLGKTLRFRRVELNSPILTIRQRRDGSWSVPGRDIDRIPSNAALRGTFEDFDAVLENFTLENCSLNLDTHNGGRLVSVGEIYLNGELRLKHEGVKASGGLYIERIDLGSVLRIERLQSTLQYVDGTLLLPNLTAVACGGQSRGSLTADLGPNGPTFEANLKVTDVELPRLLREVAGASDLMEGKLSVLCKFEGNLTQLSGIKASGSIDVGEARLSGLRALELLGRVLKIDDLSSTEFDSITGSFKIEGRKLTLYDLDAKSEKLEITGAGSLGFDKRIDIDFLIAICPEMAQSIPEPSVASFALRPDGFRTLTFKVRGTLDAPETNLLDKLSTNGVAQTSAEPNHGLVKSGFLLGGRFIP